MIHLTNFKQVPKSIMKQLNQTSIQIALSIAARILYKLSKQLVLFILFTCIVTITHSQATITAVQPGLWSDPDTWDAATVPTAADDAIIGNGISVQISSEGEVCSSLVIGTGDGSGSGAIVFSGTASLTVTGDITLGDINGATGTITMDTDATLTCSTVIEGDTDFSGIYETNLGTIVFNGTFTLPYNLFQFNNLIVNSGTVSTAGRNLPIEGDLTINSGATLDLKENTANRNTIAGILTISSGGSLKIGGGGTIPANFSTHVIGATSTIEYYGVAQTVATLNSAQNYGYLVISGSGLKEVNGSIGIARDLTINSGIFSVNTFTANRTSAGGTLTVENGATLRISGSGTIPANFTTHSTGATSTIEYNGTSSQNIAVLNSSQKYGHLNVYNSIKTLSGSIVVTGTLAFSGTPCRLAIGNNTLTLEGAIAGSLTGSRNFTGSANSNLAITGAFNRILFFDATTGGTTNVLNNLTINHNGNISTLGNDLVVNSNLTFTAGKLAIAARTLTVKGTLVNTVTSALRGGATSNLVFNGSVSPTLSMDQTTAGTTNALSTLQINSSGQVVTMNNDLQINGTTAFAAGKLAINGNTLTIKGLVTNTAPGGIRAGSTSNLVINGTVSPGLSFDQSTPGITNIIRNFTINSNGQTVTLLNTLRLVGTHIPTGGVLASGGNYTVASTASATANIASGNGAGGYITGDVIVERYIPQNTNRAWRLLASPTNGQTIKEAWQENQAGGVDGNAGYGTNITGSAASWLEDGFDFKTPSNSMLTYDAAADQLLGVSNTSVSIGSEAGYFIYIRGGRSITPSSSIAAGTATTLRTKGTLNTGDQPAIDVLSDKFALAGNPYASAIDLRNVATSGGCVGTSFYVWDPKLLGTYNLGGYQTLTPSGGNYIVTPGGGSFGSTGTVTNTIQSGAAFFVQATGSAGTVSMAESSKASGSSMVFRPGSVIPERNLVTNLYAITGSHKELADGNIVFFDDSYSSTVDGYDSRKMINFGENISMIRNNAELAIERRPIPSGNDTIQFAVFKLKRISYQLQILADRLHDHNLIAFLEDRYLNTLTPINLDDTTNYTFTVTATAASFAENRLRVVFKTSGVLPVSITNLKAYKQANQVAVEWQVSNQVNVLEYQVEKSSDGNNFIAAGIVAASNINSVEAGYKWLDVHPAPAANYYRIKMVDVNGRFTYTPIVNVIFGSVAPAVTVSPNPVEGSLMNLQFENQIKGSYHVRLISNSGQVVYSRMLVHHGGSAAQTLTLPLQVSKGIYQVEVTAPDNSSKTQVVIINTNN